MKTNTYFDILPGKSDHTDTDKWLPLIMHLYDTAGIMNCLARDWLPESVRRRIEDSIYNGSSLDRLIQFIALVHDIGKVTPVFCERICESLPTVRDVLVNCGLLPSEGSQFLDPKLSPHSTAGEAVLIKYGVPNGIAAIIGAHHGKPRDNDSDFNRELEIRAANYYGSDGASSSQGRLWEEMRAEWFKLSLELSGYESPDEIPPLDEATQFVLSGLLIVADWIASNPEYFPLIPLSEGYRDEYYPERVNSAWQKLNLPRPWESGRYAIDDEAFGELFGFAPNCVQQAIIEVMSTSVSPGICVIEAPMGCGKTEAALAAADIIAAKHECGGLFFGLPTQATANGIFPRLLQWAKRESGETAHSIRLAHGMAELNDDYRALFSGRAEVDEDDNDGNVRYGDVRVHSWFSGRKQALLADFVIGTVDQLLMVGLKQKHLMLRHLGVAGKVVIIDECHAYDAYMNKYLDRVLNWLGVYGTPVILLSATLPKKRRSELIDAYHGKPRKRIGGTDAHEAWRESVGYPLVTWTDGDRIEQLSCESGARGYTVRFERLEDERLCEYIGERLCDGGSAGIIVNTVKRAQKLAETIRECMPEYDVILIHSSFTAPDRAQKEEIIRRRLGKRSTPDERNRLIVVGTQVLEQSLDIDFDIMVTDLCPMDLLLQRVGRLHRHERMRSDKLQAAVCAVLGSDELDEGSRAVYHDWALLRTRALLPDTAVIPDDIPKLVQAAYEDISAVERGDAELTKAHDEMVFDTAEKETRAKTFMLKPTKRVNGKSYSSDTIVNLLNTDATDDEQRGEAMVRDIKPTIQVLAMMLCGDGRIGFLSDDENAQSDANVRSNVNTLSADHAPSDEDARRVAIQKLTLPYVLSQDYNYNDTVDELEQLNADILPEWQKSGWLKGELILLFDGNRKCELGGYELSYSRELGLTYTKQGGTDNG